MNIKSKLNKILFGITLRQEYLCIGLESFKSPLNIFLSIDDKIEKVNLNNFILLGYLPLLIGISSRESTGKYSLLDGSENQKLIFKSSSNEILATLTLNKIKVLKFGDDSLFILRGLRGKHKFSLPAHKLMNGIKYRILGNKKDNVYLSDNLYEQVKIAYSVPCSIKLIAVSDHELMNMFPSDLNGKVNNDAYVVSLRTGGKANSQVQRYKKILAAEMPAEKCKNVYSLSKNHMKDMRSKTEFNIENIRSEKLGLPVPKDAVSYSELEWSESIEEGIHNINLFRIVNRKQLKTGIDSLAHIHREYAEWRLKNSINTNFILR